MMNNIYIKNEIFVKMKNIIELFPKYSLYYLKLAFLMTLISQNTMYYLEKQLLGEEKFMNFFHF